MKTVHSKILSRVFWPSLRVETLILPQELQDQLMEYDNEYAKIKRGRKLAWLDHLGTIEIEVELADREVTMDVSPLQATVLYAFEEHGTPFNHLPLTNIEQLDVAELCQITGTSALSVKRAVSFWVLHGVLKEIAPDTYHVLEYAEETSAKQSTLPQTQV